MQIAFTLDDYEEYKTFRGLAFENTLDYMPGHHIYTMDALLKFLTDIKDGKDPYKKQRKELLPRMHNPCNNFCKRILDRFNI